MFDVVKYKHIFFSISAAIIILGVIFYCVFGGFNTDIDFSGGTAVTVNMKGQFDNDKLAEVIEKSVGVAPSQVQNLGDGTEASIKIKELSSEDTAKLKEALKTEYGITDEDILSIDTVSATVGNELKQQALISAVLVAILMLIYVSFRFDFISGLSAVISLIHVILIMLSFCIVFRMSVGSTFIAAILTVLGYGINDTIVVFDKIRENNKFAKKETFAEVVNKSVWQSMTRTINTSVTTLITIVLLCIMGVPSIREFAVPIIVGIISGTYSSIFIASPMWVVLRGNKKRA